MIADGRDWAVHSDECPWYFVTGSFHPFLSRYDGPSAELLGSFKTWCEDNFGSVHRAFNVLDHDGSGTISLPELRRACQKRSWRGDVPMLFRCLDVEGDADHARLSLDEIGFLDNWEVPSEDEPEVNGAEVVRKAARGSSARPPRPELRSHSQPAVERTTTTSNLGSDRASESSAKQKLLLLSPDEPKPRREKPQKDPRQEHEEWVQQREQDAQNIYRVSSEKHISSSSQVTKRLYHPHVRDPKTGVPSWLHSLRDVTRSQSEALLMPRGGPSVAEKRSSSKSTNSTRSSIKATVPPAPAAREVVPQPVYRYGAHGSVVGPFQLSELKLNPLQGQDLSRGT
eukprot:symbB.v1.2.013306.t1/scaffold936.1/size150329/3